MKWQTLAAIGVLSASLAGCGGGSGGGGGPTPPTPPPLGTFKASTNRTTAPAAFTATVTGASASGTTVQIYGDERNGPSNAYTSSHRFVITLYGPVTPGTYAVGTSRTAGSAYVVYTETANNGGVYTTTGTWTGNSGSIVINAADSSHIEGTFSATAANSATGNTITFSGGQFNVAYETPPPPPSR